MNERKSPWHEEETCGSKKFQIRDNHFVFYRSPKTLEEMASIRVVLYAWNYGNTRTCEIDEKNIWFQFNMPHVDGKGLKLITKKEFTQNVRLPPTIKEKLLVHANTVSDHLYKWIKFHCKMVFGENSRHATALASLAQETVWKCDGEINYIKTAQRLLSSSKLDNIEKCRLMFTFCLKNEIETLSSTLYDETRFPISSLQNTQNARDPMLTYWVFFLHGIMNCECAFCSEINFINMVDVNDVYAIKYFWSCLKDDELMEAATMIIRKNNMELTFFVLACLNEAQQNQFLSGEVGILLLTQFAYSDNLELAQSLWMMIRNDVEEIHFKIFIDVFARYDLKRINLFIFVWRNAPDRLKRYVLDSDSIFLVNLIKKLCTWYNIDLAVPFLTDILNDIRTDIEVYIKREVIGSNWFLNFCAKTVLRGKTSVAERMLELFLPGTNEGSREVKRQMMKTHSSKSYCARLCGNGEFDRLNEYLRYFEPDENNVNNFMAEFLLSEEAFSKFHMFYLSPESYRHISDTIDRYIRHAGTSRILKKKAISSDLEMFYDHLLKNRFQFVENCFDLFLVSPDDLKEAKSVFVEICRSFVLPSHLFDKFGDTKMQKFLLWVSNSEQNISQFKRDFCHPKRVILKMLKPSDVKKQWQSAAECATQNVFDLSPIDRFLNWYFDSKKEIRDCKKRAFIRWKKSKAFRKWQKKDEFNFKIIMTWFREG